LSHIRVVSIVQGMDLLDLLAPYTYYSELQAVTALPLTDLHTLQFTVTHTLVPQSVTVSTIHFLAKDFNTGTVTVSLSYVLQISLYGTAHINTSFHCQTFNSQLNSLDFSIICQLPTPEFSIQFSAATANSWDSLKCTSSCTVNLVTYPGGAPHRKHRLSTIVLLLGVVAEMCLPSSCLALDVSASTIPGFRHHVTV
jgi:hypothetical protein